MLRVLVLLLGALALSLPAAAQTAVPRGLRVEAPPPPAGTTTLILRWDPVPGAFGYEVFEYRNGRWWLDEENSSRTPITASTTLSALEPATPYEFRVRALGPDGPSEMSEPVGGRTLAAGATESAPEPAAPRSPAPQESPSVKAPPPDPPTGVIGMFSDTDRVQLTWRSVPGAVSYRVEEQVDGKWVEVEGEAGRPKENRTVLLEHYSPGPYRFRVSAVGANGRMSEPSFAVTVERQ